MNAKSDEKIENLLKRYESEQREFEQHELWRSLNTTPQDFFKKIHDVVKKSGITAEVWQQKLNEAKQALETRLNESRKNYSKFNFNQLQGIKA